MNQSQNLERALEQGIYPHNLCKLIEICIIARKTENTVQFFFLESIFQKILSHFSERSIPTSEYQLIELKLKPIILQYIKAMANNASPEESFQQMKKIILTLDETLK